MTPAASMMKVGKCAIMVCLNQTKASSRREDVAAAGVETTPGARSFASRLD
jgi:hypothetical protein